jgi:NodT family efflux transporter outer membrane factor (OMF) lipoprotein
MDGAGNATTPIAGDTLVPVHYPDLSIVLEASWEADLWGRLKDLQSAAEAHALASVENTKLVVTALVSDVAVQYYEVLTQERIRALLERTLAQQERMLGIMRAQKDAGRTNELAVQQFGAQVASTQAQLAAVNREIRQAELGLSLLLAEPNVAFERDPNALVLVTEPSHGAGVPSALLRNRPDIRQAELALEAAKFSVSAAEAAFYPQLTLTAGAGYQAYHPEFLFSTPASLVYSVAAGLFAPLLNREGLEATLDASKAQQAEALAQYRAAILGAFVDVQNALVASAQATEIVSQRTRQQTLLAQAVENAEALFQAARATYLDVLEAQQAVLDAELSLSLALQERRLAQVRLYRALGGGWRGTLVEVRPSDEAEAERRDVPAGEEESAR